MKKVKQTGIMYKIYLEFTLLFILEKTINQSKKKSKLKNLANVYLQSYHSRP